MSVKELLLNGLITKMKTFDEIIEVIKDYLSNQEAVIMYEKKIQDNLYMIDYMKESNVVTLFIDKSTKDTIDLVYLYANDDKVELGIPILELRFLGIRIDSDIEKVLYKSYNVMSKTLETFEAERCLN